MVAWLVKRLVDSGYTPAVLTRGYKAIGGKSDEAELLKRLTGVPVIVNPDRFAGARAAIEKGASVLVMDDGFQHLKLKRDLNIILIDATNPFSKGIYLPIGRLREPVSALCDAEIAIITRSDEVPEEQLKSLRGAIDEQFPHLSIYTASHQAIRIIDEKGKELPLQAIEDKRVCAFCGIGNSNSFFKLISHLGARVVAEVRLSDHVNYTPTVLKRILTTAKSTDAELLTTTTKDCVKIEDVSSSFPLPIWTVEVEIKIAPADEKQLLERVLMGIKTRAIRISPQV